MAVSSQLLASKIVIQEEDPRVRTITPATTSVLAAIGVTERGPVGVPKFVTTFTEFVEIFGGFIANSDLPIAMEGFFRNGGTGAWVVRTVHYTDITDSNTQTAVEGAINILDRGGAATSATLDSTSETFNLEPSQDLVVDIDNSGPDTLTFTATRATINGGATSLPVSGADSMTVVVDGGDPQVITFAGGESTLADVLDVINSNLLGGAAVDAGGTIDLSSDTRGTDSTIEITTIDAALSTDIGLSATSASGTGNVGNIDAVTASEVATLLTNLPLSAGTATASGGVVTLTSPTTGTSSEVEVTSATTADGIFAETVVNGSNSGQSNTLKVEGKYPGTYINDYKIVIEDATNEDSDEFNLKINLDGVTQEIWPNLSMTDTDTNFVEDVINDEDTGSNIIKVTDLDSGATSPSDLPEKGTHDSWSGADDGLSSLDDNDFIGNEAGGTGLHAFDEVSGIRLLIVPGRTTSAVQNAMLDYCDIQRGGLCFAILDPPANKTATGMVTYATTTAGLVDKAEIGAIYWPQIKILNPQKSVFGNSDTITVPPSGHIAGVYGRVDQEVGGVYKQPAGLENGQIVGLLGFETDEVLNQRKRDILYPKRINPIAREGSSPRFIDGSRTLKGDGNFPSIGERRGVIFIEASLKDGLLFARHKNIDDTLKLEVKNTINSFLLIQMGNGAFRSRTPSEAFFIDIGKDLNPPETEFAGTLKVRVGLATKKPAEYIVLLFSQDTRELEERLNS